MTCTSHTPGAADRGTSAGADAGGFAAAAGFGSGSLAALETDGREGGGAATGAGFASSGAEAAFVSVLGFRAVAGEPFCFSAVVYDKSSGPSDVVGGGSTGGAVAAVGGEAGAAA